MSSRDNQISMDRHVRLLSNLRHGRVQWGSVSSPWSDFRAMVPLALASGFALKVHLDDLYRRHDSFSIISCYKAGIGDWLHASNLKECLDDANLWSRWCNDYKSALQITADNFPTRSSPADILVSVMDEYFNITTNHALMFSGKRVQRLQLALLHIELLPENHAMHKHDLDIWIHAAPERRLKASPIVGEWYNAVQDPELLIWRLKHGASLDPTSYELPEEVQPSQLGL